MRNTLFTSTSLALSVALVVGTMEASAQTPALPQPAAPGAVPAAAPGAAPAVPGAMPGAVPGVAPSPAATYSPGRVITMKPSDKRPLVVKANERNPYARRAPGREELNEDGESAEETQIREVLTSLPVSGQSLGKNGLRILLGDIILEQGRLLPSLLPDQSENLRVLEVNPESIVFAWLDVETGEPTGKTLQIGYDLTPSVSYSLAGQTLQQPTGEGAEGLVAERRMGVLRVGQERKEEAARLAAKDPSRNLPREVYEAGQ